MEREIMKRCAVGGLIGLSSACSLAIGVDDYSFSSRDAGTGGQFTGITEIPGNPGGAGSGSPASGPDNDEQPNPPVAVGLDGPSGGPDGGVSDATQEPPPSGGCPGQSFSFDQLFQLLATDVAMLGVEDAPFTRYLTLTNRFNAGVCVNQLAEDRAALTKALNMLSTEVRVEAPAAVDASQTVYRIDIRDYGWDRAIVIDGVAFVDGWEAVVGSSEYAVPFAGPAADAVVGATGTSVPVLYSDAAIDAVSNDAALYYALIDVDESQTLDDFILNQLGIDVVQNRLDEDVLRSGTTRAVTSRQDLLVERHDIGVRPGAYWQAFLLDDETSLFDPLVGPPSSERRAIFSLANGLFGFVIADETGTLSEDSDVVIDTTRNNFRARVPISCTGCHAAGLIAVDDEVREFVLANATVLGLDQDEIGFVNEIYDAAQFQTRITTDTNSYVRALEALGLSAQVRDPVATVFRRFDSDMNISDAAGDLGVSAEVLRAALERLVPELRPLDSGLMARDNFQAFYRQTLCTLAAPLDNRPVAGLCSAAP